MEVISPSHLFIGKRLLTPPVDEKNLNEEAYDITKDEASKRVKYISLFRDQFWNRWSREYLQELREHATINEGKCAVEEIEVGDVVVVL